MLRKLGFGLTALVIMSPGVAAALGVGEYELNSYLNQPLDMEISLHEVGDLTAEEILVNLASQAEFDAAGVDRSYFLNRMDFEVELLAGDKALLHITTDQPVREPYLNFLVEFLWPTGRLMREYTVLLDPPSYADSSATTAPTISRVPQPVSRSEQEPQSAPSRPAAQSPTQATSPESGSPTTVSSQPVADTGQRNTYTVKASDTMWRIALDNRPAESVSVQQMLVAIQTMNSDAFINNNVNLVREGTVLRIPNEQEVRNISTRSAIVEVADQNRKWREMLEARGIQVPQQRAQLDGSRQVADSDDNETGPTTGQVKLVSPESTAGVDDGDSTGSAREGSANTAVLENELAIRDENLDRLDRENSELKSRLDDLEAQTRTSEQLLKLRNDQIAQLQEELRKLREEQGVAVEGEDPLMEDPAEPEVSAANDDIDATAGSDGDMADSGEEGSEPMQDEADAAAQGDATVAATDTGVAENDAAEAEGAEDPEGTESAGTDLSDNAEPAVAAGEPAVEKTPEVAKPKPVAPAQPPAPQQGGIVDLLLDNLMYIGLALIAILLLLFLLLRGKKKDDADEEAGGALFEDLNDEGQDEFGLNLDDDDVVAGTVSEQDDEAEVPEQTSSQDPLEDVEVYVAYGRYPQAVDFLRNEINKHPQRADLKVRLLELLKEMNDDAAFRQQTSIFAGTSPEVDDAIARLGGNVVSRASGGDDALSLDDLEMGLSSDLGDDVPTMQADEPEAFSIASSDQEKEEQGDELADFDFELDADEDGDGDGDNTLMLDASEDNAASLDDFSLDFEDDSKPEAEQEAPLSDADKQSLGASPVLELDDVSSSSLGDDDTEYGDLNLDDMSLEFDESGDSEDSKEELDLSLDDLDLDGDSGESADDTLTDLDLELDEAEKSLAGAADSDDKDDLADLDLEMPADEPTPASEQAASLEDLLGDDDLQLDDQDDSLSLDEEPVQEESPSDAPIPAPEPEAPVAPAEPEGDIEPPAAPQAAGDVLGDEDDFDFLGETDENATKLDLAKAYIDMGDTEGARDILNEVISEGTDQQQAEARELMGQVG
ncbi:FimV/HubP family polar landmark protein [Alcanivorax sp.]|uniref:FimV/HubP family polar landmark protein n=1 Tax=Alcanivorax sp. TaxID=1872427 RepID=UPI0025BD4F08|nr:FimV/HubP family polar landmark protein [Alcanivorax sp.]